MTLSELRERAQEISLGQPCSCLAGRPCAHVNITNLLKEINDAALADLAITCQRHGCMWEAPEAHEVCRTEQREVDALLDIALGHHYRKLPLPSEWWDQVKAVRAAAIRSQR